MKSFAIKYGLIFVILIVIGLETAKAIKAIRRLKKAKARTKQLQEELEYWRTVEQYERIKRELEEAKKNDSFTKELERLIKVGKDICNAKDDYELDKIMKQAELDGVFEKPWDGDFDEFMSNPENQLKF